MLEDITVLMTGAGAPGAPGIIKCLRLNKERNIRIIGVDADLEGAIGVGMTDVSYKVPKANAPDFISELLSICKKERVQVIIPLVTNELFILARCKQLLKQEGVVVLVTDFEELLVANDKHKLMERCKKIGVPVPDFKLVNTLEGFVEAAKALGYPDRKICFKPPVSNGLRGFRIVDDSTLKMDNLINEKPNNVFIGFDEFVEIAKASTYFPELLVMEYLPGEEFSIDALGDGEQCLGVIPRSRDKIKMGISFVGTTVHDAPIEEYCTALIRDMRMFGNVGFQFRRDANGIPKIIESNPRVQGTIVLCLASGYNMVYNAVKIALGEKPLNYPIVWGTKMVRFWDEMYFRNGKSIDVR